MNTTNRPSRTSGAESTDSGVRSTVVPLEALKRRKRLNRLEATRSHLATMAAQQRSHGLDDATESFNLQVNIETTIRDEFPEEYEELFGTWVAADVAAEHPRGMLNADCGICRSIATAQGVNLMPPDAA
jgi:hypothetical protein